LNKNVIERCMESSLWPMKAVILTRHMLERCGETAYN